MCGREHKIKFTVEHCLRRPPPRGGVQALSHPMLEQACVVGAWSGRSEIQTSDIFIRGWWGPAGVKR